MFGIFGKPAEPLCEARESTDGHQYTGRVVRREKFFSLFSSGAVYSLEVVGHNGRKVTRRIGASCTYLSESTDVFYPDQILTESGVRLNSLEFTQTGLIASVSKVISRTYPWSSQQSVVVEKPQVFVLPREEFPGYRAR